MHATRPTRGGSRAESSPNSLIRADGVTLIEAFVVYEAEQNDSNRHRATRRNAKLGHTPPRRRSVPIVTQSPLLLRKRSSVWHDRFESPLSFDIFVMKW